MHLSSPVICFSQTVLLFILLPLWSVAQKEKAAPSYPSTKTYHSIRQGLKEPDNVRKLTLLYRPKDGLMDSLTAFKNLTFLHISAFDQQDLAIIGQCQQLERLNLHLGELEALPPSLLNLPNLRSLNILQRGLSPTQKGIKHLSLDNLPKLEELRLAIPHLKEVPKGLSQLSALQHFSFLSNQQVDVAALIHEIRVLERLTSVALNTYPENLARLTHLRNLHLSDADLETLPASIGQLKQLQKLTLSRISLKGLPLSIGQLKQLHTLELHDLPLEHFPLVVCKLPRLTSLFVTKCQLKTIPTQIGQLKQLKALSLSRNTLKTLPMELGRLSHLEWFELHHHSLEQLPPAILQLKALQSLNLKQGTLSSIPPEIAQLTALKRFDLSNTNVPKAQCEALRKAMPNCYIAR